ncbi:hypothetical protein HPB49_023677 [Dermacentor silvarum]|uniref:Uncharacterized protein n=1 Tax=Dermacentor silvarum TaxID=543639 RepID=A0ACB8CI34_DERSI|nr:hypothetical protein HPB49_023677 [Dermacentor silvarum]
MAEGIRRLEECILALEARQNQRPKKAAPQILPDFPDYLGSPEPHLVHASPPLNNQDGSSSTYKQKAPAAPQAKPRKHGSLIEYITTSTRQPEIITLQETNTHGRLPGYVTYGTDTGDSLHTLVSKKLVAVQHHLQQSKPLAILLEIIPQATKKKGPMFVLNAYCFGASHARSRQPSASNSGRLQCSPPLCGYTYTNPRGNLLHKVIEEIDLTLVNDPRSSRRLGTSVTRGTNPALILTRNIPQACWTNLEEYLGSHHALLATTLRSLEYKARIDTARLTDWTKLLEIREERATNEQSQQLQSIKDWITQLHQDADPLLTLKAQYFPTQPSEPLPPYTGTPNELLDEDIHLHEVTAAIMGLRRHKAPGMDQITNKALVNLDNPLLLELTAHLNEV